MDRRLRRGHRGAGHLRGDARPRAGAARDPARRVGAGTASATPARNRPPPYLAIALLLAVGALASACDSGPSELTVHNRTNEAITFTELGRTNGVAACASARFTWPGGRWEPADPTNPAHDLTLSGTPVGISAAPMFDAIARVAVIVTEDGVRNYPANEVPELPPCGGRAPAITPEPTDPPLDTP